MANRDAVKGLLMQALMGGVPVELGECDDPSHEHHPDHARWLARNALGKKERKRDARQDFNSLKHLHNMSMGFHDYACSVLEPDNLSLHTEIHKGMLIIHVVKNEDETETMELGVLNGMDHTWIEDYETFVTDGNWMVRQLIVARDKLLRVDGDTDDVEDSLDESAHPGSNGDVPRGWDSVDA